LTPGTALQNPSLSDRTSTKPSGYNLPAITDPRPAVIMKQWFARKMRDQIGEKKKRRRKRREHR
jgi:hypothetical protein